MATSSPTSVSPAAFPEPHARGQVGAGFRGVVCARLAGLINSRSRRPFATRNSQGKSPREHAGSVSACSSIGVATMLHGRGDKGLL
jgi:hypothetical protein